MFVRFMEYKKVQDALIALEAHTRYCESERRKANGECSLDRMYMTHEKRWSGKYFLQIRGLAMGQRLAPSLAILMYKVEAPLRARGPLLYCRYSRLFHCLFHTGGNGQLFRGPKWAVRVH
ncbi:hypothetical protein KIN20_031600 [Parelaphostrongylus tenuis]|uniref:Uncharacterized protein n=1 Tax=Parelaphostrongylus tenuis TaxID=148309 RepID=A0AAD5R5I1_PARTN|nr:hypothetical protein KIN20_031600 [Parelaphostrongylus tenuis]